MSAPSLPGRPDNFGDGAAEYRAAVENAALFDTSDAGHIEVTGRDAARFLHNLTTNDIVALAPGTGCEAFCATHKAKAIAYVYVYRLPGEGPASAFWVETGPGFGATVFRHLDKYLVSEAAELFDRSSEVGALYIAGPNANAMLTAVDFDASELQGPNAVLARLHDGAPVQIRRKDVLGVPGFTILAPRSALPALWQRLTVAGAHPAGQQAYDTLRIEAGTPVFGADIDEERFVVEVGRGKAAVSTNKGCYLGQEPIVMARDRGHVNRQLLGIQVAEGEPPPQGTKLFKDAAEVGQVTSSVRSPRFGVVALAYIRRGNQEPGTLLEMETPKGRRRAMVSSLPFQTKPETPA
jgi:folate-binding protein YgfZ